MQRSKISSNFPQQYKNQLLENKLDKSVQDDNTFQKELPLSRHDVTAVCDVLCLFNSRPVSRFRYCLRYAVDFNNKI